MQLGALQPDGAPLRTHLQRRAQNTGQVDPMLMVPPVPSCAAGLWRLWCRMSKTRPAGMGPSPITHQEIDSACRLYQVQLSPWEVETLLDLDDVAMRHAGEQMSKQQKQQRNKARQ